MKVLVFILAFFSLGLVKSVDEQTTVTAYEVSFNNSYKKYPLRIDITYHQFSGQRNVKVVAMKNILGQWSSVEYYHLSEGSYQNQMFGYKLMIGGSTYYFNIPEGY